MRREFRRRDARFNGRNLPSVRQLRRVVKCFEESGSVHDRRKKIKSKNGGTFVYTQHVSAVQKLYSNKQRISLSKANKMLRLSKYII